MKPRLTFFFRHPKAGISIEKVFSPIVAEQRKVFDVRVFHLPRFRADPLSVLVNLLFVWRHRDQEGVNHITGDIHYATLALADCASVLTIHDNGAFERTTGAAKKSIFWLFWFAAPVFWASRVTCISKHTQNGLRRILGDIRSTVIHNAVAAEYTYSPWNRPSGRLSILQIGTTQNKNLPNLIAALRGFDCDLRIVGALGPEHHQVLLDMGIRYSSRTGVSEREIVEEYRRSDIVSFCSTYEGFGMPIIEANAIGRCVVTANRPPMTEVAGNAAVFVDPMSPDSIRAGILRISEDAEYAQKMIALGQNNARRFSVLDVSQKYKYVYMSIINMTPPL